MKVTSEQLLDLFGLKIGSQVRIFERNKIFKVIQALILYDNSYKIRLHDISDVCGDLEPLGYLLDKEYEIIKHKPTLTEDEKVILRNLFEDGYKYVYRYEEGILKFSSEKPYKKKRDNEIVWAVSGIQIIPAFKKLFTFITWEDEEPYNIEELLKGTL